MSSALASPASQPVYAGQFVTLRTVDRADYPTFLRWRTASSDSQARSSRPPAPSSATFEAEMEAMLRQSIVLLAADAASSAPIGFLQAYNINPTDGWCMVRAHFEEAQRSRPPSTEAWFAIIDYLLGGLGLQKLYIDLLEFDSGALEATVASLFAEEGRFREHTRFNGRYWDVVRLAVYREAWPELRERIWFILQVGTETSELLAEQRARRAVPTAP